MELMKEEYEKRIRKIKEEFERYNLITDYYINNPERFTSKNIEYLQRVLNQSNRLDNLLLKIMEDFLNDLLKQNNKKC